MNESTLRRHTREPFTIVRNAIYDDDRLTWKAKGILSYLLGKPDGWVVRVADVVNRGKEGRDAVRAAFHEMVTVGYAYLEPSQKGPDGKFYGAIWHISELPEFIDHPPGSGFPSPEEPASGLPASGKPTVSKKERSKKDVRVSDAEAIYAAYPKKVAKPVALKEIALALQRKTYTELLAATTYLAERWKGADVSFCQRASVWFKEERYDDDPETWGPREKARKTPAAPVPSAPRPAKEGF